MRLSPTGSKLSIALVTSLALILGVLAVLQYQWSGIISQSNRERIQASLDSAILQFRLDFNRELLEIAAAFQPEGRETPGRDWNRLAKQRREWIDTAPHADLVSNLYFWERPSTESSKLFRLERAAEEFEETAWPDRLSPVRDAPWRRMTNPRRIFRESSGMVWFIIPSIPVLVHPVYGSAPRGGRRGSPRSLMGCIMVELDEAVLCGKLFPELAQRYFAGPRGFVYQVAIVRGGEPGKIVYRSHPNLEADSFPAPDARITLSLQPMEYLSRDRDEEMSGQRQLQPVPGDSPGSPESPPPSSLARMLSRRGPHLLTVVGEDDNWELLAQHTQGSLDAAVASLRRRNLAISFGILLLLALSMTMIIVSTQRAKRLAKLQMEFVAGVSHELRTPLTVICSAGENLADGVVADSARQVKQYGELVLAEGRRLAGMVEQILQFAKIQSGRKMYNLLPARIGEIIEVALAQAQPMIESEEVTLVREISPDLPMARVDAAALLQCLQNLINNAMKYGGGNHWLRISASSEESGGNPEIQISIEDSGMGINPADLPHIFDPFYRGSEATSAQIHGSGLGLSMARDALSAMGGRIAVRSSPGKGSTFTIHIPAIAGDEQNSDAAVSG